MVGGRRPLGPDAIVTSSHNEASGHRHSCLAGGLCPDGRTPGHQIPTEGAGTVDLSVNYS